jgi:integrase
MASFRIRGDSCTAIVRKKKDGKLIYSEYRTWEGLPKAEQHARDWARRLEETIERDGVPLTKTARVTLGGLLRKHKEAAGAISRSKASELDRLIAEFDGTKLEKLRPVVFTEFAQRRREIRSALSVARVMYDLDVNADVVKEAMVALTKMKVIGKGKARTRRPTEPELSRLDEHFAAKEDHPLHFIPMRKMMWLAIALPRRVGELTAMLWVDLQGNIITLRDTKHPVAPRIEHVPVLPEAAKIIDTLPRNGERICPYNSDSISMSWTRACKRLGIEDLHFHDLRREGVSRLFAAGYTIPEVASISGHLDWAMLKIYTELRPRDILEKFA